MSTRSSEGAPDSRRLWTADAEPPRSHRPTAWRGPCGVPRVARCALIVVLVATIACSERLDEAALAQPESCETCHPEHYEQWSSSAHAFAADDPVFEAMNARGQRETGGALADQCLRCHAPMAVRQGASSDGLNLADLPQHQRGVTCVVCHVLDGQHDSDNRIGVTALQGGLRDPVEDPSHDSTYSPLHDRTTPQSSQLCGRCHQRTYDEWSASLFQTGAAPLGCGGCHMQGRMGLAAQVEDVPVRRIHDHRMPGAQVALTEWVGAAELRAAVQRELDSTVGVQLCVGPTPFGVMATVILDNIGAGHAWPTSSSLSRRAWVEVVAVEGDAVSWSSGTVPDGAPVIDQRDTWILRTRGLGPDGAPEEMPWRTATIESEILPVQSSSTAAHTLARLYQIPGAPSKITARVHLRPIGLDVVRSLQDSGDLAEAPVMPTFTLAGSTVVWDTGAWGCVPEQL